MTAVARPEATLCYAQPNHRGKRTVSVDKISIAIGVLWVCLGMPVLIWGRATFHGMELSQRASRILGLVVLSIGVFMLARGVGIL